MDDVNRLLDYLEIRSPATRQIYASMAQRRHLKKGEVLYRGGEDTTYLYFLISGCLRGYTVNANGREYTECILYRYGHSHIGEIGIEHEFRLNKNLEALTDADLLFFDIRPIMKVREIMREPALVRYQWFQKAYPNLQDVMQLKDVASFLGITPVTLSRIRAKEAEESEKGRTE